MPWTGKTFASRHNHALSGAVATKAAKQANAMLDAGVPEGEAIATANKHARRATVHTAGNSSKQRSGKSRSWTGK